MRRPERTEAAEYYANYIGLVPDGDIRRLLHDQLAAALALFDGIGEEASRRRYAPGKWSVRELLGHVSDTERVFVFRAFWFARGFDQPLPGFDQDVAAPHAAADARSWRALVEEFRAVRAATCALFDELPDAAWSRHGVASGYPFTVRALAYIPVGHVTHHLQILRERYLA